MMIRTFLLSALLFLPGLLAPLPAAAFVVIDDFNVGTYWESVSDTTITVVPVGPAGSGHVISPTRRFHFRPSGAGGALEAEIGVGGGTRMRHWSETGSGNIEVEWRWGFAGDLTEGGAVDSICFTVPVTPPSGGSLFMTFEDTNGLHGQAKSIPAPGTHKFPLSDWGFIDMTQVVAFSIHSQFSAQPGSSWEIDDIRTKGQGTITPNLVGNWTLVETNPLPSAPCVFTTLDEIGNQLYQTQIGWQDIQVGGAIPVLHGVWSEEPFGNGETCGITMTTDFDGGYNYEWFGYYEMFVDFADVPGRDVELMFPPDPVHDLSSVALPIHVMTYDQGAPTGDSHILMTVNLSENQPAEIQNPMVTPVFSKNQSTLTGFVLGFELITLDIILDSEPVFEIDWASDWMEISVSTGVVEAGAVTPSRGNEFTAAPSITRGATELRAALPFASNDAVSIFDVRGRLVRTLLPSHGTSAIVWDGRGSSGARVAAGVYFARRTNDHEATTARIIQIR